ncbi:MAG: putative signal transduction protein with domain [Mycobacterium sp.]|jgi:CBS domain-containing protein|nr:putative signal transduction protein with domain [Mycobacterium sp.]MCW2744094.1 putative signal transduction protein with domain [Mycobacterium sp.]
MQVRDVMSPATLSETLTESLRTAAARMWAQQTGSLLVLDGGLLRGIVTERDIMKAVARGMDVESTPVSAVMTPEVMTVNLATPLFEAARLMAARWIRHLPVVDDLGDVVGILSQRDLVGVFAALAPDPDLVPLASDAMVRDKRLARLQPGDLE